MSATAYWYRLIHSNAGLRDEEATLSITVKSFRKQIEKAYEEGAVSVDEADIAPQSPWDGLSDIFGFGKGKK
jgi:hypothetical protein